MAIEIHVHPMRAVQGTILSVFAEPELDGLYDVQWAIEGPTRLTSEDVGIAILGETTVSAGRVRIGGGDGVNRIRATLDTAPLAPGAWTVALTLINVDDEEAEPEVGTSEVIEITPRVLGPGDDLTVRMRRTEVPETKDEALWRVIGHSTTRLGFENYSRFMDQVMCGLWAGHEDGALRHLSPREREEFQRVNRQMRLPFPNVEAYRLLKVATEVFVMLHCGVHPDFAAMAPAVESRGLARAIDPGRLERDWEEYLVAVYTGDDYDEVIKVIPYMALIRDKLRDLPITGLHGGDEDAGACYGILADKLTRPCFIELIWTYWMWEARLPHTLEAVTWRFQNRTRHGPGRDPLRNLEIDPLRRVNNLLWGHIQDEQHRLTPERIAYECVHEYGVSPSHVHMRPVRAADSRSRFMESFHHLLALCAVFFTQDDDTTVIADGFAVLNGLRETHLVLTQSADNQWGHLPSMARMEGLMQQWILGRPEMREFLPGRTMVAYPERWMDRVEAMKTLQGWDDTPVLLFRDLAVYGEQILLSIRYGAWATVVDPNQAANWARAWRPAIQTYTHAAGAVAGMDLVGLGDGGGPAIYRGAVAGPVHHHQVHHQRRQALPHSGQ